MLELGYRFTVYDLPNGGTVRDIKSSNLCIAVEKGSLVEETLRALAEKDGFSEKGSFTTNEKWIHYSAGNPEGDSRDYHCDLTSSNPLPIFRRPRPNPTGAASQTQP